MQLYEEDQNLRDTLNLPCPSCGSQLLYSAEKQKINCEYCGYVEEVNTAQDQVVERSLNEAIESIPQIVPEKIDKKVFHCESCGAQFMVEQNRPKISCGFCGSNNVNLEAFEHRYIQPVGIIPFYIGRAEADKRFLEWIGQGFFHPSKLKKLASRQDLHGVYIPFWTYDAQTEAQWRGEAGFFYYETKTVRKHGQVHTEQVQKVRWERRSGSIEHFFDDVLVVASGGLEQKQVNRLLPFRLEEVVNFDPRLMMGWEAEVYQLEVDEGYRRAERIMEDRLRQMCSAQLGGDTQRNLHVQTEKHAQTFKHLILPLWICSYRYQNKLYRFYINGQTGKVHGEKPLSWIKITILVIVFVLIMVGIWYLRESGYLQS
ncbi:MAG: hypothetical protein AAFW73_17925 [Bacteroidota bacterium]